ncbi:single-stranded-DNA-specific exonuclease RecJ [Synechococcus sp. NOUM97013]|uniref:single-stranded-DNA-specific exonuclease RecJ n=1 Tax=Synechococcus sp. NOUM97013 TaxID=1442555 RepID=UPI0016491500|nr:single-stranded-DNA-specific exonuclease RecJ [Synechococcus sp. NOUM97013]QNI73446.1 single-stranded DNA-specific exonuclease [Synechococcus sp. NOUM97013]
MAGQREQQWQLPAPIEGDPLHPVNLPPALKAVLFRRGLHTNASLEALLSDQPLPAAHDHFPELEAALQRLKKACHDHEAIAICGDYDADGMTSTALLMRAFAAMGAAPQAAIPSRMADGYGLNPGMVEELHTAGVGLLVTVDNGVAAHEALTRAEELNVEVILTDHHTLPASRPKALALIHPATTPEGSPYAGLAGVGLAYVLARELAAELNKPEAIRTARDLFCIGTVADMAPLTGANRVLLKDGLKHLHRSRCAGVQALQQLAGLGDRPLRADDIGFQLAPRINAVGRIGEPALVVDLLTADDPNQAFELGRRCDALNRQRRELCDAIEAEAIALLDSDPSPLPAFLLLAQSHWHHGVIGIVAARLVERYQRPAALLASDSDGLMRASVRAPEGFAVDQALQHCTALLERHGGHPAAGGFTVRIDAVSALHEKLNDLAADWLIHRGDSLLVEPEALLELQQINHEFWKDLQQLEPFGAGHPKPLFWARGCRVADQQALRGGHLRLTLEQNNVERQAIVWRWPDHAVLPQTVDVAFHLTQNHWRGETRFQLEVKSLRAHHNVMELHRPQGRYRVERLEPDGLKLVNPSGDVLVCRVNQEGVLDSEDSRAEHPYVAGLLKEACVGLGLRP